MPRAASLLGSVVVGAALLAPPGIVRGLGIAPAEAAAHYTRKKVNGRWVKGNFTKADTGAKAAKGAGRVRFTEKKGFAAKARYASLPKFKPKVVLGKAAVVPAPPVRPVETASPAGGAAPAAPTAADLASLPPDRVIATASISPAPVVQPNAERMRPALEARARSMASEFGNVSVPLPEAAPPAQLSARSVTFDLQKGVRTIVFDDGATVTAPFDKERASDLTGLRPASP